MGKMIYQRKVSLLVTLSLLPVLLASMPAIGSVDIRDGQAAMAGCIEQNNDRCLVELILSLSGRTDQEIPIQAYLYESLISMRSPLADVVQAASPKIEKLFGFYRAVQAEEISNDYQFPRLRALAQGDESLFIKGVFIIGIIAATQGDVKNTAKSAKIISTVSSDLDACRLMDDAFFLLVGANKAAAMAFTNEMRPMIDHCNSLISVYSYVYADDIDMGVWKASRLMRKNPVARPIEALLARGLEAYLSEIDWLAPLDAAEAVSGAVLLGYRENFEDVMRVSKMDEKDVCLVSIRALKAILAKRYKKIQKITERKELGFSLKNRQLSL